MMRQENGFLVTIADHHFALDANEGLGRRLLFDASRLDQEHEGTRAAVHDRHFTGAQFDKDVVDPQAREGRHQMLDRRHLDVTLRKGSTKCGVGHQVGVRRDLHLGGEIGTNEDDAGIDRCRTQGQTDLFARV